MFQGLDLRVPGLDVLGVLVLGLECTVGRLLELRLRVRYLALQPTDQAVHNLLAGLRDLDVDTVDREDLRLGHDDNGYTGAVPAVSTPRASRS